MVEMKKDVSYPLVYSLVTLTLILLVVTATVERVFSAMNIIKIWLRNRMRDQWMYDCLVTYIEKCVYIYIYIYSRLLSMKKSCNGFKIWKIVEGNWVK